ncbi:hypothetical protein SAMN05660776_2582 [Salegentibacter holothuriorum]|uniref:Uncharacterized protein n=1 Tax=Salegentibacter holothuriorum TaxID=241145 RepID=A0A1T5DEX7_9FLAO|nr:hypothetical protein [Salegentibacter holothuriorum]SKB70226.1 hypothetical protein SAMN05660776_2582 [Salegentibacter holothuriorum]
MNKAQRKKDDHAHDRRYDQHQKSAKRTEKNIQEACNFISKNPYKKQQNKI